MKQGRRKRERVTDPNPRQCVTRQKWGIDEKKRKVSNRFLDMNV